MTTHWKRWLSGVLGLALVLPIGTFALSQDEEADDDRPRAERRVDDEDEPNRAAQRESAAPANNEDEASEARDKRDNRDERDARDGRKAPRAAENDRAPRSVTRDRLESRDRLEANVQDDADAPRRASPSDLPPRDLPPEQTHMAPRQHAQGQVVQRNCCCGSGGVVYSQNNGYRSAQVNNGGYRSFSYQGGEGAVVDAAPAPVYDNSFNGGYYSSGRRYGGVQNGANWDRSNEHDSRNFSGSYGSRASLRYGR